jgi:hypothetical protein
MTSAELGWTKVRTKPTQPGNALALVVDDGDPRAKVRHIAANRPHGAEFADMIHGALARAKIGLKGPAFQSPVVLNARLSLCRGRKPFHRQRRSWACQTSRRDGGPAKTRHQTAYRGRSAKRDTKKRLGDGGAGMAVLEPNSRHGDRAVSTKCPPVPRGFETPAYWTVETGPSWLGWQDSKRCISNDRHRIRALLDKALTNLATLSATDRSIKACSILANLIIRAFGGGSRAAPRSSRLLIETREQSHSQPSTPPACGLVGAVR